MYEYSARKFIVKSIKFELRYYVYIITSMSFPLFSNHADAILKSIFSHSASRTFSKFKVKL